MTAKLPIYYLAEPDELTSLINEPDTNKRRQIAVGIIAAWKDRAPESWRK